MRVLISGGFGFVGGRVAKYLQQAGYEIILGSRNAISSPDWLPKVKVVKTNWNDLDSLEEICTGVDVIIHASGMNAKDCEANPVAALELNGVATARFVRAASVKGVSQFIYLSTAHVYASPLVGVISETNCPRNLHPYATSHLAGENAVLSANQSRQIQGAVLRLSNAFGAPMHKDVNCWMLLINDLCRQAVTTKMMVLYTTGLQQRNFVTLDSVCRVIEYLLAMPSQDSHIYNVGSNLTQTVWDMACLVQDRCKRILGFLPKLTRIEPKTGELISELDYRLDNLLKTDYRPVANEIEEIDQLIKFCQKSFSS